MTKLKRKWLILELSKRNILRNILKNLILEIRKKIMACMMQGKKRFHSANNKGLINNSVFEGVTTAEIWSDRVLGKSQVVKFSKIILDKFSCLWEISSVSC
jgi:hypothetical protein